MTHIYHLNCGSMHPYWPRVDAIVYCLLIETNQGLLLVDTGLGLTDRRAPVPLVRLFMILLHIPRDSTDTAVEQVRSLGYTPDNVLHIVMTHLHFDHAGGLPDFPKAQVHVYTPEYHAAQRRRAFMERFYTPAHWAHTPRWALHEKPDRDWYGLPAIQILEGLEPQILLIPLVGHTPGHCGVAISTDDGWLLHCGDAANPFYLDEGPTNFLTQPPQWLAKAILGPHIPTLRRLHQEHPAEIHLISSHDPYSFHAYRSLEYSGKMK